MSDLDITLGHPSRWKPMPDYQETTERFAALTALVTSMVPAIGESTEFSREIDSMADPKVIAARDAALVATLDALRRIAEATP